MRHKAIFLDNGQSLAAYPDLQQEFVLIAEKFKEKKKPLVIALDDCIDQSAVNPKLRARLESGLSLTLKKPDLEAVRNTAPLASFSGTSRNCCFPSRNGSTI